MSPPSLPLPRFPIPIASRMLSRPFPQAIPIPTLASLVAADIPMTRGGQDGGVGRAHDVLAQGVEAVEVVLEGSV